MREAGGAAPSGGLQFDTFNEGDWIGIGTVGPSNTDFSIYTTDPDQSVLIDGEEGVLIEGHGDNGLQLKTSGDGDMQITLAGTSSLQVFASSGAGHFIRLFGLPTVDPGIAGALWNDAGTLKIS